MAGESGDWFTIAYSRTKARFINGQKHNQNAKNSYSKTFVARSYFQKLTVASPPVDIRYLAKDNTVKSLIQVFVKNKRSRSCEIDVFYNVHQLTEHLQNRTDKTKSKTDKVNLRGKVNLSEEHSRGRGRSCSGCSGAYPQYRERLPDQERPESVFS